MITRQKSFPAVTESYILWNGLGSDENNVVVTPSETLAVEVPEGVTVEVGTGIDRISKRKSIPGPALELVNITGATSIWIDIDGSVPNKNVNLVFTDAPFIEGGEGSAEADLTDYYTKEEVDILIEDDAAEMLEFNIPFFLNAGETGEDSPTSVVLDEPTWNNLITINEKMSNGEFPNVKVNVLNGDAELGAEIGDKLYEEIVKPKQIVIPESTPIPMIETTLVLGEVILTLCIMGGDLENEEREVAFIEIGVNPSMYALKEDTYTKDEIDAKIDGIDESFAVIDSELEEKISTPTLINSSETEYTISMLDSNMVYNLDGNVTSLTIEAGIQTITSEESVIYLNTGNTIAFSYATAFKVIGSDELLPNKRYVISIQYGIIVIGEVSE